MFGARESLERIFPCYCDSQNLRGGRLDRCLLRAEETVVGGSVPRQSCGLSHDPKKRQRFGKND